MFDRLALLMTDKDMSQLKQARVLVVGLGGVGGYAVESLARSGIEHFLLIDYDQIEVTNLNRQIIALHSTLGKSKTTIFKDRLLDINPNSEVILLTTKLTSDLTLLDSYQLDYIVDACDTINVKIALIKYAQKHHIKLIASMGMGNRLDPTKVKIVDLSKTTDDPIARAMRYELRKEGITHTLVAWSSEIPLKTKQVIGSYMPVPATAGILISHYIISDLLNK